MPKIILISRYFGFVWGVAATTSA